MKDILCLDDFETAARKRLPRPIFAYYSGGVETNQSLRDNRSAFQELGFVPRALANVAGRSTQASLFGERYAAPFGIAPMGLSALSCYRGDVVLARAAEQAGIPMIMSATSLIRLEEVKQAAPKAWFQAYLPGTTERIEALVDRIAAAGHTNLVVTVDVAVLANRENNIRAGFTTPLRPSLRLAWDGITRPRWTVGTFLRTLAKHGMPHFENSFAERGAPLLSSTVLRDFVARDNLDWSHVELIRRRWKGKFILKGILSKTDAVLARSHGVDAIMVSNHGGRQLDGAVSPLRVLPEIAEAIGGSMPVILDSGIRRGSDVLKALALGADFVFIGRPFLYAAAVGGEAGVLHAAKLLQEEVQRDMALLGVSSVEQLGPEHLRKQ
ncbi:(S)-mandelate dehydrogenase [Usitatibacter rugosus]|uniref:(S)-mandelate dehydrogenase n=1 Tax=Usitatibacter rugosus TaxID=2732067 RepID=A0A6M4GQ60_9PROT|nr:alpha-hydroxy acid oxidase [Usitatibacter rugosus]QJR09470.1 (S)-mandelate dehydrogenase [Usitatibacter rugosus]